MIDEWLPLEEKYRNGKGLTLKFYATNAALMDKLYIALDGKAYILDDTRIIVPIDYGDEGTEIKIYARITDA